MFYLPFLLKIQLPSTGFLREEQGSATVAATDLPRVSAEAETQMPLPGRDADGEGVSVPRALGGIGTRARFDL